MAPRAASLRRLGVFGGSFDPVHVGHLLLARRALEQLRLDEVWLIPCARSADGKRLAPGEMRLRWLRRALRGQAGLRASDLELRRGGVSRSVDTLRELRQRLGAGVALTLCLGQDQAAALPRWKEPWSIAGLARLAVFGRGGQARLPKGFSGTLVKGPELDISSNEIRSRIRAGRPLDWLLAPGLAQSHELKSCYKNL